MVDSDKIILIEGRGGAHKFLRRLGSETVPQVKSFSSLTVVYHLLGSLKVGKCVAV